jgi:kynurenine formamidase
MNISNDQNNVTNLPAWKVMSAVITLFWLMSSCSTKSPNKIVQVPSEIIDLGTLVTEDLPERLWGNRFMEANGFNKSNIFEDINIEFELGTGIVSVTNSYYTLFNHGGPHIDGPNHVGLKGGLDSYPPESFTGQLRVFDVSTYAKGRTVPIDVFKDKVTPGDVVLVYTNYDFNVYNSSESLPESITLTYKAAEYLASIPVNAFGTDAFSVDTSDDNDPINSESSTARAAPVHYAFMSRGIPIYEQLFNVSKLLNKQNMYFVGAPLNIKNGNGMIVRPIVLVY